ncbi:MAG: hypothetical protein A2015_13210 [Spirochaetes bacterium GWF1_31_7]|nr:MAG: hypothetical protein A2Y30_00615 [Spirochaetes bacterium GWE1_32_154]OHD51538.1 MAG: hypothetical protein A2015_13210 [Spirochaetes bacterium GWF1_31_7]OHD52511.1 MAG: hypothetical protein A2Y29_15100 [Spirochaetes bacterium GWE2_31_10]OHD82566.1 MAG: hypothetical protein A2355_12230 [Spirochaetes bacterium RIFOXYB1_FULL_32_8]HBD95156.1 3-dehydroquinate synthase II [Spirochaetia bacterium]
MKKVYLEVVEWNKSLVTDAIENGVDAFFTNNAEIKKNISELAKVDVYLIDDLPDHINFFTLDSKDAEIKAAGMPGNIELIIKTSGWTIIPYENLIAVRENILATVSSVDDAIESIGILEKGVTGVYVSNCDSECMINILKTVKSKKSNMALTVGEILSVEKLNIGDRVCIDTISSMKDGEGMLVGDYSNGMLLVNSESVDNPYVASRPFRVNAGAVHCYVMTPGNRTKYLSDLRSGDDVLIVNSKGECYTSVIGRIKQEKRPMLRIVIKGNVKDFSVVLQNAETIRVVTDNGSSKSVVELKTGDKVTIFEEVGGRHFGHKITETIDEK